MAFTFNWPSIFSGSKSIKKPDDLLKGSATFCMAPWCHIHVLPSGKIFPCCMSAHLEKNAIGDLHRGDTLKQAWNSLKMRTLRKNMLHERKTNLCERCYIAEHNGQNSFRQSINFTMAHHVDWTQHTMRI